MTKPIQSASTLSEVTSFLKSITDKLFGAFDKMLESGKSNDQWEVDDTTGIRIHKGVEKVTGIKYTLTVKPLDDKDSKFDIELKADNRKSAKRKNIQKDKIADVFNEIYFEVFEVDPAEAMNASKRMNVTLKRVCGATEDIIELTAVTANYEPTEAYANLLAVVSNDEFANSLPADCETSFEIVDEGNELDVCQSAPPCVNSCYVTMMTTLFRASQDVMCVHWNAIGAHFEEIHYKASDMLWRINSQLDTVAEWCVEKYGHVPHPAAMAQNNSALCTTQGFNRDDAYSVMRSVANAVIATYELYYCNLDHDMQSRLDEWIREWKSLSDYKFAQAVKC